MEQSADFVKDNVLEALPAEQHIYHHYDNDGAKINVKVERNSKGYNWEVTVMGASTIAEACKLLYQAEQELQTKFGQPVNA